MPNKRKPQPVVKVPGVRVSPEVPRLIQKSRRKPKPKGRPKKKKTVPKSKRRYGENPLTRKRILWGGALYRALVSQGLPVKKWSKRQVNKQRKDVSRNRAQWRASAWSKADRQELMRRCGTRCFLDPANYEYPVCASYSKDTSTCRTRCTGVDMGRKRAERDGHRQAVRAAKQKAKSCVP